MIYKPHYISRLIRYLQKQGSVLLLESQLHGHSSSRKSYLAGLPEALISANGSAIEITSGDSFNTFQGDPWIALQDFRNQHKDWLLGYFGYDLKNFTENLQSNNKKIIDTPDMLFMVPGLLIELDEKGEINLLKGELPLIENQNTREGQCRIELMNHIKKGEYLHLIDQAQHHITEGDYYEINLSHPLEFNFEGTPWNLYQEMRKTGPVPFGAYIFHEGISVCSASPERFLSRMGGKVTSQPIKGTVSRQAASTTEAAAALLQNEKERAENLMIVDLVRNDLSKFGEKGSVEVPKLFEIQSFETVHQLVSTVSCRVNNQTDSIDIIKACFPMGSMTGAPKIAAMQAIEKLENYRRGIYSGAIGYIKPDGDFDFNVVIRTAILYENKLVYPVGGAITSDSDPQSEWDETWQKAQALTNII